MMRGRTATRQWIVDRGFGFWVMKNGAFAPFFKSLDHRQHQPEVSLDQRLSGICVAFLCLQEQAVHLGLGQYFQLGGVHTADFHFPLHTPSKK